MITSAQLATRPRYKELIPPDVVFLYQKLIWELHCMMHAIHHILKTVPPHNPSPWPVLRQ